VILRRITRGRSTDGADIPTPVRRPCYRCATLTGASLTGQDALQRIAAWQPRMLGS
jgi:hypothetical protein